MIINRYPIKLPPSVQLDFAGRLINIFHIIAHIFHGLKALGFKNYDSSDIFQLSNYLNNSDTGEWKFLLHDILDYIGWIAIFSRLNNKVPFIIQSMANSHFTTAILCSIDYEVFANVYLRNTNIYSWELIKFIFIFSDAGIRGYYQFYVLHNY